uniref:GRIP and coiled-coil domain-containing protein 2-like n=1 Tax=Hirondellea gigas TaxID=1518452 RepID=A0A6A7FQH7_9CRUS
MESEYRKIKVSAKVKKDTSEDQNRRDEDTEESDKSEESSSASKLSHAELENKISTLTESNDALDKKLKQALHNYQTEKVAFETTKDELSKKIKKAESECKKMRKISTKSPKHTANIEKKTDSDETGSFDEGSAASQEKGGEASASMEVPLNVRTVQQFYPTELITAWSGTMEELECNLSLAKDELLRCGSQAMLLSGKAGASGLGSGDESVDNITKIASLVRRVEELSGVLAATRIRRGIPVDSPILVTEYQLTQGAEVAAAAELDSVHTTHKKSIATWLPFATQEEFEAFLADKEKKINELEKRVNELEEALNSKSSYISQLEHQLKGTKGKLSELENSSKSFEDHLEDINRLNRDITKLKDELEQSHSECTGLKTTIAEFGLKSSEKESDQTNIVGEIENILQSDRGAGHSSEPNNTDLEQKKNLDERLKYLLSTIESRILGRVSSVESAHVFRIAEIESSYESRISSIKDEYDISIEKLQNELTSSVKRRQESSDEFSAEKKLLDENLENLQLSFDTIINEKTTMEEKLKVTENKVGVLNEVKRKLVEYTKTIEERMHSSEKHNIEASADKKKIEDLNAENIELQANIASLNEKIDSVHVDKTRQKNRLEGLETSLLAISDKVDLLQKEKESFEAEHAGCTQQRAALSDTTNRIQKQNDALTSQLQQLNKALQTIIDEKQHLQSIIDLLNKEKSATQTLQEELERNLVSTESEGIANKLKSDELLEFNASLQDDIKRLHSSISDLETDKKYLNSEIENLKYIIEGLKEDKSSTETELDEKLSSVSSIELENVQLNQNIDALRRTNNRIAQENICLQAANAIIETLKETINTITEDKANTVHRYEEDQQRILEMQNMMVTDMETLILSLEADKNSLAESINSLSVELYSVKDANSLLNVEVNNNNSVLKQLKDNIYALEKEKGSLGEENRQLRTAMEQAQLLESSHGSSALQITQELIIQTKDLQHKLESAQSALNLKENEYMEKMQVEKGGIKQQLQALRKDMTEEMDIIESRKEEETEELEEKFAHLEVEFTTKLAETKEYYESLMIEEKAEFGRVLVTKISDYERKLSEKFDEISGWHVKLMSMQEELDGKMMVIEELEGRLEEFSDKQTTSNQQHASLSEVFGQLSSDLHHVSAIPSLIELNHRLTPLREVTESPTPFVISAAGGPSDTSSAILNQNPSCTISSFSSIIPQHRASSSNQVPESLGATFLGAACAFSLTDAPYRNINSSSSVASCIQTSVCPYSTFDEPHMVAAVSNKFSFDNNLRHFSNTDPSFVDMFQIPCVTQISNINYSPSSIICNSNDLSSFNQTHCKTSASSSKPILSFVIPSTFSDMSSCSSLNSLVDISDCHAMNNMLTEQNIQDSINNHDFKGITDNSTSQSISEDYSSQTLTSSMKSKLFVSREFPFVASVQKSDATENQFVTSSTISDVGIVDCIITDEEITDIASSERDGPISISKLSPISTSLHIAPAHGLFSECSLSSPISISETTTTRTTPTSGAEISSHQSVYLPISSSEEIITTFTYSSSSNVSSNPHSPQLSANPSSPNGSSNLFPSKDLPIHLLPMNHQIPPPPMDLPVRLPYMGL